MSCCRSTFAMSKFGRTRRIFALGFLRVSLCTSELMFSSFGKKSTSLVVRIDRGGWATTTWLIGYADVANLFIFFSTFFKSLYPSFFLHYHSLWYYPSRHFSAGLNRQRGFSLCHEEFKYSSLLLTSFKRGSHIKNYLKL